MSLVNSPTIMIILNQEMEKVVVLVAKEGKNASDATYALETGN